MNENLTPGKAEFFHFEKSGHNILIIGQAGTEKSRAVNVIRDPRSLQAAWTECKCCLFE